MHLLLAEFPDGNSINSIRCGAVDEEHVGSSVVAAADAAARIRLDAPSAELNHPAAQAARLALGPDEDAVKIDRQVVSLIDTERLEHAVSASHKLRKDDRFRSFADIHGVAADLDRGAKERWSGQIVGRLRPVVRPRRDPLCQACVRPEPAARPATCLSVGVFVRVTES